MSIIRFPPSLLQTLAIAFLVGALAPACGTSTKTDAGAGDRPFWPWDVLPNLALDAGVPDLASDSANPSDALATSDATVDLTVSADVPNTAVDAIADDGSPDTNDDLPDPGTSYLCSDGYICLVSCENRCGLHELGRSVCTCTDNALDCTECVLSDLARPQVPQFVTAVCADGIVTDVPCTQVGDACFLHPAWPYPDGCLCWPTDHGLVWGCAPVFGWFTSTP
jgi:hypothetical protein